jgi:hypothetical protein
LRDCAIREEAVRVSANWIEDWRVGIAPDREREVATELVRVFTNFWNAEELDERSASTRRRYAAGLHSLGGYVVETSLTDEMENRTAHELLNEAVCLGEGPLIHSHDDVWQRELDAVCRRLHKFLKGQSAS